MTGAIPSLGVEATDIIHCDLKCKVGHGRTHCLVSNSISTTRSVSKRFLM